jgi:hypothetical protein
MRVPEQFWLQRANLFDHIDFAEAEIFCYQTRGSLMTISRRPERQRAPDVRIFAASPALSQSPVLLEAP